MPFNISAQIETWRTQLLDTSKRNRLINFKTGQSGGILLVCPDPGELWPLLVAEGKPLTFPWKRDLIDFPGEAEETDDTGNSATLFEPDDTSTKADTPEILERCRLSPRLRPDHLLTELTDKRLGARLTRLAYNGRESLNEQGVTILYVAFGFLRWFESPDSKEEVRSPLLLVPVRLDRDSVESPWRLQAEDEEILPNHTLAQRLLGDFKLNLPTAEDEAIDPDDPAWRTGYLAAVQRCVRHHPRWEVSDETALGAFNFQKLAMWEDLGRNQDRIKAHDLCRAIAGDRSVSLRAPADLPAPEKLDEKTRPDETHHILDADSSQHAAIVAAVQGASLVLDGPPGTGKSQTIANTIAEFLAAGKTVLFVSEKTAALDVVKRRLDDRHLGDFCLELHSHKANKRAVLAELGRCLDLIPETNRDSREELARLLESRSRLNSYVRELHAVRQSLGRTAYQVHGELARLDRLTSASRCPVAQVLERDAAFLRKVTDLLGRLPDCRSAIEEGDRHPWRGFRVTVYSLTLRDDVQYHFGKLADCALKMVEAFTLLHRLGLGLASPSLNQCLTTVQTSRNILSCPQVPAAWFESDPRLVAGAVVQLEQSTRACRKLRDTLIEFSPDVLRRIIPSALPELFSPTEGPRSNLSTRDGETVRSFRQRLIDTGNLLRAFQRQAKSVEQAAQKVVNLLGVRLPPQPVRALRRFAAMADQIARMKSVRPSWWEARRRTELRNTVTQCREEVRAAQELRAELIVRISPKAFAPENASLAFQGSQYNSLLSRLWPWSHWWLIKRQVSDWYTQGPPRTAALLEDFRKLATYHRRMDYCHQIQNQYVADLLFDSDGQPDWEGMLEALDAVDRLEQFGKIPATIQVVLSRDDSLDRETLATAAAALADQTTALLQQWKSAEQNYDLREVEGGSSRHIKLTAHDLVDWLGVQIDAVDRETAATGKLCELLAEGHDLSLTAIPDKLGAIAELAQLRLLIERLVLQLRLDKDIQTIEDHDWSESSQCAKKLLCFLDSWSAPVSPEVVQALTNAEVRARVAEAIRLSDAALAEGLEESWQFLTQLFDTSQDVSSGITIDSAPLPELHQWLTARVEDAHRIQEWTQFREIQQEIAQAGVLPILQEILRREVKLTEAADAFRARFFRLWLDALYEQVPALRQFSTDSHERLIERFRTFDRHSVEFAPARIRNLLLARPDRPGTASGMAPGSSELGTLLREVNKKRRHLPLRKLFAAIPSLLPRLKPCLMMSPLAVSTYLQSPDLRFDLVIFDEASQVRPHDAICAIYRGRQLLVAGDQKQLPPTSFFERTLEGDTFDSNEAEDDETGLSDFESILDVCCTLGLLRRRLRWHYRSRREALIAFANHHVYANELVTFPSVHDLQGNPAVTFEYIAEGRWKAGAKGGFNAVEARRTAERILQHYREYPEETLGVIAFSQRQQMRIFIELEHLRHANPDLEEFFREERDEPFFVKNLENVQGDERDVILLSVGYGPDETGRVAMRFGPLNRQGGERRLNVAVTRARKRMAVISSLRAWDIDLSRTSALGARLFRAYLDYAERGTDALLAGVTEAGDRDFDSPFEQEVYEELTRQGLMVHRQVGCSGFRIDLAIADHHAPGRYLLGVECDGATYHSSATARDRDRLRQAVLESLGWRICRVWSTDWVRDRSGQVRRILAAFEKAQQEPSTPNPPPPPGPVLVPPKEDRPVSVSRSVTPTPANYESIDAVPASMIREELLRFLRSFGATEINDLIRAVARQLGFRRTGQRIQARIQEHIESLLHAGQVGQTADQRLQAIEGHPTVRQ